MADPLGQPAAAGQRDTAGSREPQNRRRRDTEREIRSGSAEDTESVTLKTDALEQAATAGRISFSHRGGYGVTGRHPAGGDPCTGALTRGAEGGRCPVTAGAGS